MSRDAPERDQRHGSRREWITSMKAVPFVCVGLFLAFLSLGCATNQYQKFYAPNPGKVLPPASAAPKLLRGGNTPVEDIGTMLEENYTYLGSSNFNGARADVKNAVEFGQSIGATAVVVYSNFTDSEIGSIPLLIPNAPITSTTIVQGSVSGSGGTSTYSGTGTTTTTGGYTVQQRQYQVNRFDRHALYFAPALKPIFGVYARDLKPDERASLERNRGALVAAVRRGSPAFRADVLRGDVVVDFSGGQCEDEKQFNNLVQLHAGQRVTVKVMRRGTLREIEVQLDSIP